MAHPVRLYASALSLTLLLGCAEALRPGEAMARDPNDPGRRTLSEFVEKASKLSADERIALFNQGYAGKVLEVTAKLDVRLEHSLAFSIPPEQYVVWATFTGADEARAREIPQGRYVRIRGTLVETIERNSVSLDKASIVAVY